MKTCLAMVGAAGLCFLGAFADESGDKGDWTVSGDVVVDAAGVTCSSITFTENATVSGGPVTLGAGGISVAAGKTATIESAIGGDAAFMISGGGSYADETTMSKVYLKGDNDFTGVLTVSNVWIYPQHDHAFGSSEAKTILASSSATFGNAKKYETRIFFGGGICVEEEFDVWNAGSQNANSSGVLFDFTAGSNSVASVGSTAGNLCMNFAANTETHLGSFNPRAYSPLVGKSTSVVCFDGPWRNQRLADVTTGVYVFGGHAHEFSSSRKPMESCAFCPVSGTTFRAGTVNVLSVDGSDEQILASNKDVSRDAWLRMMASPTAVFDLNGYDQLALGIAGPNKTAGGAAGGVITSDTPALLRLHNITPTVAYPSNDVGTVFSGKVSLRIEEGQPYVLTGASTTDGLLVLTNKATVTFAASGSWQGTNVCVQAGSRLTIQNPIAFSTDTVVELSDDETAGKSVLELDGVAPLFGKVLVNGKALANGSWGAEGSGATHIDNEHFAGSGSIVIAGGGDAPKTVTWTGAKDSSVTDEENWENGVKPDSGMGLDTVVIRPVEGRTEVVLDEALAFRRLEISLDAVPSFAVRATEVVPTLRLGDDGLDFTGAGATLVVEPVISLPGARTISIGENATIDFAGGLLAQSEAISTIDNLGTAIFRGAVGSVGNLEIYDGVNVITNGAALGVAGDTVLFRPKASPASGTKYALFCGVTVESDLTFDVHVADERTSVTDDNQMLIPLGGTTNVFNGKVTFLTSDTGAFSGKPRTTTVFAGGVEMGGAYATLCYNWNSGSGDMVIRNKPFKQISGSMFFGAPYLSGSVPSPRIDLHAPSNTYSQALRLQSRVYVTCHTNDAIYMSPVSTAAYGGDRGFNVGYYSTLDLNGHDIHVGCFCVNDDQAKGTYTRTGGASTAQIVSGAPGAIRLTGEDDDMTWLTPFRGWASLAFEGGTGSVTLESESSTTGGVSVATGRIAFGETARWPNASRFEVTGGTLAVTAANQLNRKADWYVDPANGKIEIPAGVTLRGHNLYFKTADGWAPQPGGDYLTGGDFVTGGGTLHMTGNTGVIFLVR